MLFVTPVLAGGVASSLRVVIRELERQGVRCGIFAFEGDAAAVGVRCSLGIDIGNERRLILQLALGSVDILHLTSSVAVDPRLGRIISLSGYGGPIVSTTHTSQPVDLSQSAASAFTAVSPSAASATKAPDGRELRVIPNAPDTSVYGQGRAARGDRPVLLWVGRTSNQDWSSKDVIGFLLFAATLDACAYQPVLVDGEDHRASLGLDEWLEGSVDYRCRLAPDELAILYRQAAASGGAWISTSRDEGMPMCLLEAWACGCPVIVPDVPGFDMVQDQVNGLKYARSESFRGLVRCVEALKDTHLRQSLIDAGLRLIQETYNPGAVASQYLALYEELLSGAGKPVTRRPFAGLSATGSMERSHLCVQLARQGFEDGDLRIARSLWVRSLPYGIRFMCRRDRFMIASILLGSNIASGLFTAYTRVSRSAGRMRKQR